VSLLDRMVSLLALRLRERGSALALRRAPHRPIAAVLNHQMVKITGRLRPLGELMLAPLSGRPCAYYSITVERPGELVVLDEDGCDFLLEEGRARAAVHARSRQTHVVLHKDASSFAGPLDAIKPDHAAFLRWHGWVRHRILGFAEPLVFKEGVLEPGELVAAYGVGQWELDPDPNAWSMGYRDFPRRLNLGPLPDGRLHLSDLPELVEAEPARRR
jgi:hypothetical protein